MTPITGLWVQDILGIRRFSVRQPLRASWETLGWRPCFLEVLLLLQVDLWVPVAGKLAAAAALLRSLQPSPSCLCLQMTPQDVFMLRVCSKCVADSERSLQSECLGFALLTTPADGETPTIRGHQRHSHCQCHALMAHTCCVRARK